MIGAEVQASHCGLRRRASSRSTRAACDESGTPRDHAGRHTRLTAFWRFVNVISILLGRFATGRPARVGLAASWWAAESRSGALESESWRPCDSAEALALIPEIIANQVKSSA